MSTKPTSIEETSPNNIKEQFEALVIAAPKDGIGNARGMMDYITGLMQQAYDLGGVKKVEFSIEESPEEAAKQYVVKNHWSDEDDIDYISQAYIAGRQDQKEVDKAKVEQIFDRAIASNNEFIQVMEKQGTPSDQTALYLKKLNRDLTDLIKQIKAL